MKIRLLTSIAGQDFAFSAGDLYDCDTAQAKRMIAEGLAEDPAAVRTATTGPDEAAVREPAKGRPHRPAKG